MQFLKIRRQVASIFKHVRNLCDIAATNLTEIAETTASATKSAQTSQFSRPYHLDLKILEEK